jgi:SAM-dependent methyltransferase
LPLGPSSLSSDSYAGIAEFYTSVPLYSERPDIKFYVEQAAHARGPVLELGCGTGRVLIPVARAGSTVVGVDRSIAMARMCSSLLKLEPMSVRTRAAIVVSDMRSFYFQRRFGLVTLPFGPFQHLLTVEDQLSCLASIYRHLRPRGGLVFDVFNFSPDALSKQIIGVETGNESDFCTPDGRSVSRKHRVLSYDPLTQIVRRELIYYVTNTAGLTERLVHSFAFRFTGRYEAEHLLARSGFEVEGVHTDFDATPFGPAYRGQLIFVARKRSRGARTD